MIDLQVLIDRNCRDITHIKDNVNLTLSNIVRSKVLEVRLSVVELYDKEISREGEK